MRHVGEGAAACDGRAEDHPCGRYSTYTFVRQSQTFPDVILRNLADESDPPIMGIELKGWYLFAKKAEPEP